MMFEVIHPRFLEDADVYQKCREFWRHRWYREFDDVNLASLGWREPWMDQMRSDLEEGNPIFTAVSPLLGRGVRIIQHPQPDDGSAVFQSYFDASRVGLPREAAAVRELVICCTLTKPTADAAFALIKPWVTEDMASQRARPRWALDR